MLKDKLLLLAINPVTGYMGAQNSIGLLHLAAILYDLVLLEKLSIISGKIYVIPGLTGDPVLDDMIERLSGAQGKKLSTMITKLNFSASKIYKAQITHLKNEHKISIKPVVWLGIKWFKRYRVNRSETLKSDVTILERVLIYGRKTDTPNRLLIELLGFGNLLDRFFNSAEFRQVAKTRFGTIGEKAYGIHHESLTAIRKQLISQLRASKAMKG